jgi:hypothetical protein
MANEPRVVFDANVLISALLLPLSTPRHAVDRAFLVGKVLTSEAALVELHAALSRPKFDKYISAQRRSEFLTAFVRDAELAIVTASITDCRDPKDNMYLELAVSGSATHLVTGDTDLLIMNSYRGIAVLTPQKFLIEITSKG